MTIETMCVLLDFWSAPASVDYVRKPIGDFRDPKGETIDQFDALHQRVVLIRYLIFPPAESSTTVDINFLEFSKNRFQEAVTIQKRSWIPMVRRAHPDTRDLVGRFDQLRHQ